MQNVLSFSWNEIEQKVLTVLAEEVIKGALKQNLQFTKSSFSKILSEKKKCLQTKLAFLARLKLGIKLVLRQNNNMTSS